MSESVSNTEIEDVLTSIRRLVSNDVETSQGVTADKPAKPASVEKLILTADFRVSEPRDTQPEEESGPESPEPPTKTEAPIVFRHADTPSETAAPSRKETGEAQQDSAESAATDDANAASSLEDTIAELEAAIGQQDGTWEPDGSGFEEDIEAEEVMSEPVQVQDWVDSASQKADIEETVAAAVADVVEATTVDDVDAASQTNAGTGELVIDEETLRDMVGDIVRQELQGALGERITRNVRKLVRREINQVLASQDFD